LTGRFKRSIWKLYASSLTVKLLTELGPTASSFAGSLTGYGDGRP
jgi:hypothetical protein